MMRLHQPSMKRPVALASRFLRNESGATAIEYGLIAALVAVSLITALQSLRNNLSTTFNRVGTTLTAATR